MLTNGIPVFSRDCPGLTKVVLQVSMRVVTVIASRCYMKKLILSGKFKSVGLMASRVTRIMDARAINPSSPC